MKRTGQVQPWGPLAGVITFRAFCRGDRRRSPHPNLAGDQGPKVRFGAAHGARVGSTERSSRGPCAWPLRDHWNPEIIGIDGRMALNERITARVRLGSGAIRRASMRVTAFETPSRIAQGLETPERVHGISFRNEDGEAQTKPRAFTAQA